MADLYVDLSSMNGLYNQLSRASGDAGDALAHVHTHGDLAPHEAGFLGQLMTPHRTAYGQLTEVLVQLRDITRSAATRVNLAQVEYSKTDHAAAAAIDRSYAGAEDPIGLRGDRFDSPPHLDNGTGLFVDEVDATRFLRAPEYATSVDMWDINPLADLLSPAAWVRQAAVWAFDVDPFENWAQNVSGNWKAYLHAGIAMGQAGAVIGDVGRNMLAGARDVPFAWRGQAADGFEEFQYRLARSASEVERVCGEYAKLYAQAAEAIKMLTDGVAGLLMRLIDALIIVSGAIGAGTATIETVVGPIAGYSAAAYYAWQAAGLYKEISFVYGTAEDSIKLIKGSIDGVITRVGTGLMPDIRSYHHPADE